MLMTDEQRYSAVLKELGEVLQEKNTTISCQKWQIDNLKEKLEAAEMERDAATAHAAALKQTQLDSVAIAELRKINEKLREAVEWHDCSGCSDVWKGVQDKIKSALGIEGGAAQC